MNNPSIRKKIFDSINEIMRKDTTNSILKCVDNFIREDSVWYICTNSTQYTVDDCIKNSVGGSVVITCIKELLNQK